MASSFNFMFFNCILFLILVSIISLLIVLWLIKTFTNSQATIRFPPSPPALPIIGHLHLLSTQLPKCLQTLSRRYGPLMQIRIGATTYVVVSNASVAKEILKTKDINFSSRYESGPCQYNIYKGCGFITAPYGPYWRFMKKLCATRLFAGAQLDRFNHMREQEFEKLMKSLMKCCDEGEACNLGVEVSDLMNNLTFRMTMSKKFSENGGEAKRMRMLILEIMELAAKFGANEVLGFLTNIDLFGNGKKIREAICRYDVFLEEIMKDYEDNLSNGEENNEDRDLMDIVLETYRDTNAEMKLTRNNIKYFFMELFMASVDTTSAAIQWTMAELINRPEVFKKLRDEIESVVGLNRLVKESDVPKLPYLQAIVKESLRLHPPGPIMFRECIADCKIKGFDVKARTKTLVSLYAIMRDPDSWNDPDEYLPERFLSENNIDEHNEMEMKGQDFRYLPYGGGRRGCSGAAHAHSVMHTTIGALVQCFDWKVKGGEQIDIIVGSGFAGAMAVPLTCYPITRFNPFK
ncbi:3,9-dihydroxypterocarpan 6A-monooxygenase-like [Pistacia vera]|uniref:3,9-dihydroxypterocarpan 6A-monooxygenase-like n=1 Tax=Pistacia vera TaxID=55513 RepID=UPI0012631A40|nr:3,9-dihydroxypterocarpan 6A-monooxygenase-like [Pistacia vera]